MADHYNSHHHLTKKPSWGCTVVTQSVLCLALFAAFKIGRPQTPEGINTNSRIRREPLDLYFLSVRGGTWPLKEQTQLLRQMAKAVKIYNAKFVVNISELGEDDPLMQNATLHFPFLKIPWYTTIASHGHILRNFLKNIKIPYSQALDIIGLDTGQLQQLNETESDQLRWLQRTLAVTDSNWRIVVGFDPLIVCKEKPKTTVKFYEPLHLIFMKHGVNAYLSQQGCASHHYHDGDVAFIGNPGPSDKGHRYLSLNKNPDLVSDMSNGFLLHRVSPLEIDSYFIDSTGKVISKSVIYQRGRSVM